MFALPSFELSDILSFLQSLRITTEEGLLPCTCKDNGFNSSWGLPTHPIESNSFIGDTVWSNPITMKFNVFVKARNYTKFLKMVDNAQETKEGFTIYSLGGVLKNMFADSISKTENSDVASGYFIDISFIQVTLVDSASVAMPASIVKNAPSSDTINEGTKTPQENISTIRKGDKAISGFLQGLLK